MVDTWAVAGIKLEMGFSVKPLVLYSPKRDGSALINLLWASCKYCGYSKEVGIEPSFILTVLPRLPGIEI